MAVAGQDHLDQVVAKLAQGVMVHPTEDTQVGDEETDIITEAP